MLGILVALVLVFSPSHSSGQASQSQFSGNWAGSAEDSLGKSTLVWAEVSNPGDYVAGAMAFRWKESRGYGTISGNVSGKELSFLMRVEVYEPPNKACKTEFRGKARVEGQAIVGTYEGVKCSKPVRSGRFSLAKSSVTK